MSDAIVKKMRHAIANRAVVGTDWHNVIRGLTDDALNLDSQGRVKVRDGMKDLYYESDDAVYIVDRLNMSLEQESAGMPWHKKKWF